MFRRTNTFLKGWSIPVWLKMDEEYPSKINLIVVCSYTIKCAQPGQNRR